MSQTQLSAHPHRGRIRRADAVIGAVVWWACHLAGMSWLIPRLCTWGVTWPLWALTAVLLALIGRAGYSGIQLYRAGRHDEAAGIAGARRDMFLGWSGVALSVFFAVVTLAESSPALVLDPCW